MRKVDLAVEMQILAFHVSRGHDRTVNGASGASGTVAGASGATGKVFG